MDLQLVLFSQTTVLKRYCKFHVLTFKKNCRGFVRKSIRVRHKGEKRRAGKLNFEKSKKKKKKK